MKKVLCVLAATLVMVSCGGKKVAPTKGEVEVVVPCKEFKTDKTTLRANANAISPNMQNATDKALAAARRELATSIETSMQRVLENFSSSYDLDEAADFRARTKDLSRMVVNQKLRGSVAVCDKVTRSEDKDGRIVYLTGASWSSNNVATVEFTATVGKLDPAQTELVAFYSLVKKDVQDKNPEKKASVTCIGLGYCSDLGIDAESPSASFPLWSSVPTNYYVRVALSTNVVVEKNGVVTTNRVIVADSYSAVTKEINVSHAIEENALIYIVTANPKMMCYGDTPQAVDYELAYAGVTNGWGWVRYP